MRIAGRNEALPSRSCSVHPGSFEPLDAVLVQTLTKQEDGMNPSHSDTPGSASPKERAEDPRARHTPEGAPTDAAHQDAGDGALTGSTPAGLTRKELLERAQEQTRDDAGTE